MKLTDIDLKVPLAGLLVGVSLLAALRTPASASAQNAPRRLALSRHAQGSISGTVVDTHGDAVPAARVSVVSDNGDLIAESISGAGGESVALGEFRIDQLPRGNYSVRVTVGESKSAARIPRVPVAAWEDTRVEIRVDLGY